MRCHAGTRDTAARREPDDTCANYCKRERSAGSLGTMAQNDVLKRYLDAGLTFTLLTQQRAEALVRELVAIGEIQADQAQAQVQEFLDRSRRSTEKLVEQVIDEVRAQVETWGLATRDDIARIERRIDGLLGGIIPGRGMSTPAPAAKKAPAKKTAGR